MALREIILFEAPHGLPAGVPADVVASAVRSRAVTSEGMQSICKDSCGFRVWWGRVVKRNPDGVQMRVRAGCAEETRQAGL